MKKNEQWSVPNRLKVYQVPRRIDGCQCTMGRVLFCRGVSTSGVFKNGCTSVKLEEGAGRLSKSTTDGNIERVRDMTLQNRLMTTDEMAHQPEVSHSATCEVIHHKLAFIKSDHDRFRSYSQNHTNRNVLTFAKVFLISVVKKVTSCLAESSRVWKMYSTLRTGK